MVVQLEPASDKCVKPDKCVRLFCAGLFLGRLFMQQVAADGSHSSIADWARVPLRAPVVMLLCSVVGLWPF